MITNLIIRFLNSIVWTIIHWSLNKQWSRLGMNVELKNVYDHILNLYETEYVENGLVGVLDLRRRVKAQIEELSVGTFLNKQATRGKGVDYVKLNFEEAFKDLATYKDIFFNVKWTVEMLVHLKRILSIILNAIMIPIIVLNIYILVKRLLIWFSFATTSSLGFMYFSQIKDLGDTTDGYTGTIYRHLTKTYSTLWDQIKSIFYPNSLEASNPEISNKQPVDHTPISNRSKALDIFHSETQKALGVEPESDRSKYLYYAGVAIFIVGAGWLIYYNWDGISKGASGLGGSIWSWMPQGIQDYFDKSGKPGSSDNPQSITYRAPHGPSTEIPMMPAGRPSGYEYTVHPTPDQVPGFDNNDTSSTASDETIKGKNKAVEYETDGTASHWGGGNNPAYFTTAIKQLNKNRDLLTNAVQSALSADDFNTLDKQSVSLLDSLAQAGGKIEYRASCKHLLLPEESHDDDCWHCVETQGSAMRSRKEAWTQGGSAEETAAKGLKKMFRR